jgi:site-specific DNA-methyltransferase (adenine-specific)
VDKNQLYYGDNLEVLRQHIKDESVDLIYLDPPFNSRQDYNVLFAEKDGTRSSSQIMAFEDSREWNVDAERAYEEIVEQGGRVSDAMRAFLGHSDLMACLPSDAVGPSRAKLDQAEVPQDLKLLAYLGADVSV